MGRLYPASIIIGVDRSVSRLSKNTFTAAAARKRKAKQQHSSDGDDNDDDVADSLIENSNIFDSTVVPESENDCSVLVQRVAANVWLVRAELADFWRLLIANDDGVIMTTKNIERHYLLYPNPYPKPARLKQRWYAHPAFPLLFQLGGGTTTTTTTTTIVRSNWAQ